MSINMWLGSAGHPHLAKPGSTSWTDSPKPSKNSKLTWLLFADIYHSLWVMLIYSCFFLVLVGSVVHCIVNELVLHVILITWCTNLGCTWHGRGIDVTQPFLLWLFALFNPYSVFVPCNVFNPNVFNPFSVSVRGGGGGRIPSGVLLCSHVRR